MLKKININATQIFLFLFAIVFYATFGQPTPDSLGAIEMVIALLPILSIGVFNFIANLTLRPFFEKGRDAFEKIGSLALCFLFIVPTLIGVASGNDFNSIMRDIIPLIYSFIPVFMYNKFTKGETAMLYYICVYAGVMLSFRFLMISGFGWELLGKFGFSDNNMYLAISPFVLFTILFMFMDFFEEKNWIKKTLMIVFAIICAGAMLATTQRASAGLGVAFIFIYLLNKSKRNVLYLFGGILAFSIIYILFKDYISTAFDMMIDKTRAVGMNSRVAEFSAAIAETKNNIFHMLFGRGWGHKFYSPAIVEEKVNFTHCMFSFFLMKTGVVGTVIYSTYIISILGKVFYNNKNLNFISYACLAPLAISMTLYTGYKYLDFGCLLLVLLLTKHIPLSLSKKRQQIIEKFTAAKIDSSVLDSSIIMQKALGINKITMMIEGERVLTHREISNIDKLVRRRLKNEPIARIEELKEFWGLEFKLNKDTLVPRPDSESVIESILENFDKDLKLKVLDLGTGSGCLLLSTLYEFRNAKGMGVDISNGAIKQARENARRLGLKDRCVFRNSNWFDNVPEKYDIIISNPPYVKRDEKLSKEVEKFDPHRALFADNDGLKCYEDISKEISNHLNPGGKVFLEIGVGQKAKVSCFMKEAGLVFHSQKEDLGGKIRCLVFEKKDK